MGVEGPDMGGLSICTENRLAPDAQQPAAQAAPRAAFLAVMRPFGSVHQLPGFRVLR